MRTVALLCLLVIGGVLVDLSAWAWGNDVLVFDGPVTCFDADYSSDGTMYVVFQRAHPDWPICYASSNDHGRTWEYHGSVLNAGERLERVRVLVGEYQDSLALYVFYVLRATPSMTRVVVGDAPTVESVAIAALAAHAYDFDVAMASEHVSALEDGAGWPHEPADELPILFGFREAGGDTIYLHRSQNGGMTWREVHTIDDVSTYGGSAGLALAWGPPSTFFYVWKRLDPELAGCDDPPEGHGCYTAYWGWNKLNGNPFSLWAEGWVLQPGVYDEEYDFWTVARYTNDYYYPQLAMSFNPYEPTIWAVFHERRTTNYYVHTAETGWERGPEGTALPDMYVSDIEPYRVLGNPYVNYVDVTRNEDGDAPNNCIRWSWSQAGQQSTWRLWSYDDRCVNDHDTNIVTPGFGPQLIYSPGSEIGGAGIVYLGFTMDGGPPEPALYFDAPWFQPVILFESESPAEPWSSFVTLDSEPSEHPMTYVPEPDSRDIWFSVAETAVCRGTTSHELEVSWSATGLGASISVSIQIADSLKVLAVFETDQTEGMHRFLLDRPAGRPITVTIWATDSAGTTMKAKSITLSPC